MINQSELGMDGVVGDRDASVGRVSEFRVVWDKAIVNHENRGVLERLFPDYMKLFNQRTLLVKILAMRVEVKQNGGRALCDGDREHQP